MTHPALLVLEDGTTLRGTAFGADGETFGEMVFNTAMTGYQETLTDPSYCRQIVAMTAPHIGNTGVNEEDPESRRAWVSGYVVREPARLASSWRATRDLDAYPKAEGVTGNAVRGTRLLTRRVRERGAMRAATSTGETSPDNLLERLLARPELTGGELPRDLRTPGPYPVPRGRTVRRRGPGHHGVPAAESRGQGLRGAGGPGHDDRGADPGRLAGRRLLQQRARRPGCGHLRGRRDARGARRWRPGVRHLPGQPDPGPGPRPGHLQAPVRPPRREPAGDGPRHQPRLHHQPQPRLRRRPPG